MRNTKTPRAFPKGDPQLPPAEVAFRMGCSLSTVRRLIKSGALLTVRPRPNIVRVPQSVVDDYLAACTTGEQ